MLKSVRCRGCDTKVVTLGTVAVCRSCKVVRDREYWQGRNRRRRAALRGVPSEPYTLAEIAERDGFCCRLCDVPVDMGLPWPDRWSASIDHAIPLVLGGHDTRANVQLAHLVCNSRKGASLLGLAS